MPAAARLGDNSQVDADAHGCPACPHPGVGPIAVGSPDVFINDQPAARQDDIGLHAACCGPNNFTIKKGSPTVYVNGKPLARMNDTCQHCGGSGPIIAGSPDVMIDDSGGDAQGLGSYTNNPRTITNATAAAQDKGQANKGSDAHDESTAGQTASDVAKDAAQDEKAGTITAAAWSLQRAANGQEVELQIETKNGKGQLTIEIWAQSADRTQDQKVMGDSAAAADSVKKKVTLQIPPESAAGNECYFYFVVKDASGGERKSPPIFVDRAPFRFSV
jgi:uncharacterized Zn-binding protein involved in type VI secretion